jgi:hypothetical protein
MVEPVREELVRSLDDTVLTEDARHQSIYDGAVQLKADLDQRGGARSLTVDIAGPHAIQLLVHLPVGYPSTDAPVAEIYESFGLSNAQRDEIVSELVSQCVRGLQSPSQDSRVLSRRGVVGGDLQAVERPSLSIRVD